MATASVISCKAFTSFLASDVPVYDKEVIKDIRPYDGGLMGYYITGAFEAYSSNSHTFDRFRTAYPDTTKPWTQNATDDCVGNPCDLPTNQIDWGYDRYTYNLESQEWRSRLICFDQVMTRTRAKEQFTQIVGDVLTPASRFITTDYLFKRAIQNASRTIVLNAGTSGIPPSYNNAFQTGTFNWDAGGYTFLNTPSDPTSKLTYPVLQQQVDQQWMDGAISKSIDGFNALQLHTDKDSYYGMVQGNPTLYGNLRWNMFDTAAKEYYKYGLRGTIGDYMVKILMFPLRFNKVSAGRYQFVAPYTNDPTLYPALSGIRSDFNPAWVNAQYQFSLINNPRALRFLTFMPEAVNKEMPFLVRDYGGKWRFGTHDLGADCDGNPIENLLQNKGKFFSSFRLSIKAEHPEWLVSLFHKREPACVTIIPTCNADPGYPAQNYSSVASDCVSVTQWTATAEASDGHFHVNANTVLINGNQVTHAAVDGATLAAWVVQANLILPFIGVWAVADATNNVVQVTQPVGVNNTITLRFQLN